MRRSGLIFGLIIVLIGAVMLFDNLDISGSDTPGDYWPVLVIVLGFSQWAGRSVLPGFGSLMLMTLGGILLTQNLVDDTSFRDLWPALAIAFGVSVLTGPFRHRRGHRGGFGMRFKEGRHWGRHRRRDAGIHSAHDADEFFSGSERQVDGEYTGSTARVKLAGGLLDLTRATLPAEGATLELDVMLGGYKLRVPNDWKLDIRADVTMGDIEDNRPAAPDGGRTGPTLTIEGRVFMGGVDISE